ncbi:MAG: class I SAM-dependent methyltransferase [Paracoccus sp. (in: a-proteobacteria)]|nr:class I SAM-dependent methyltransferase [Paracoccus sp. (in: a-proteobacteria)]
MGISINIAVQLARIAPLLRDCRNGVMLGRQKMHFRPPGWTPQLIDELGKLGIQASRDDLFQEDGFCETYLNTIGWPKLESLDFSAIEGAEYIHDLSLPVGKELQSKFDLIYDGGTTEHVFDIAQSFRNVDAMLRDNGIFVSCVGTDGWFGHGFYQVGPDIPWRYWVASLGYKMLGCWTFSRKGREAPRIIEDPTSSPRGAEHRYSDPQFIFYVVQKLPREGDPKPIIQSHYVNY